VSDLWEPTAPTRAEVEALRARLDGTRLRDATAPTDGELARLRPRAAGRPVRRPALVWLAPVALGALVFLALRGGPPPARDLPAVEVVNLAGVRVLDAVWTATGEGTLGVARRADGLDVEVRAGEVHLEARGSGALRVRGGDTEVAAEDAALVVRRLGVGLAVVVERGAVRLLRPVERALPPGPAWPPAVAAETPTEAPVVVPAPLRLPSAPAPTPPGPSPSATAAFSELLARRESGTLDARLAADLATWVAANPNSPLLPEALYLALEVDVARAGPAAAIPLLDAWIVDNAGSERLADAWWLRARASDEGLGDCAGARVAWNWLANVGPMDGRAAARAALARCH